MNLLIPLGLLALLSLIVLLIIYIIRPNYQQRFVSSTYVWKLSLKYRRRRIPVNRLRNILIIICQILILVALAFIIAEPVVNLTKGVSEYEVAIVMDSSSSMRSVNLMDEDDTRFSRAVSQAKTLAEDVISDGGIVSVILVAGDAEMMVERKSGEDAKTAINEAFDKMLDDGVTYGTSDINLAIDMCEDRVLAINPDAEIKIYTDETYANVPTGIEVINVAYENADKEWNAAILNAYTEKIDGYYALFVEFATYGKSDFLEFEITLKNTKYRSALDYGTEQTGSFTITDGIYCDEDGVFTFMLMNEDTYLNIFNSVVNEESGFYSVNYSPDYTFYYYEEIEIRLTNIEDSYDLDDVYYVYDGEPNTVKVLYAASDSNKFTSTAISAVQSTYADEYEILVDYVYPRLATIDDEKYTTGYDLYIYEGIAPSSFPTDGIVFLFDPNQLPEDCGLVMDLNGYANLEENYECYLRASEGAYDNPLMRNLMPENIFVTQASLISVQDASYTTLMEFDYDDATYPALLMKNDGASKIIIMPFSVHYSNIALRNDFPLFYSNLFTYFFPAALGSSNYLVGDAIDVNVSAQEVEMWYTDLLTENESNLFIISAVEGENDLYTYGVDGSYFTLPLTVECTSPGRYRLITVSYYGSMKSFWVFAHADSSESDIFNVGTALSSPYSQANETLSYDDLLLYFAIALVAIIFIEWILHMLEGI